MEQVTLLLLADKWKWLRKKNKLRVMFPVLTHTDLFYTEDKQLEMFSKIQVKLGKTKEEFADIISLL